MLEGEIIKFYREKSGLTQAMLGEGICTPTHVSKIERGKTAYSPEIISLFSAVLNIDIQRKLNTSVIWTSACRNGIRLLSCIE